MKNNFRGSFPRFPYGLKILGYNQAQPTPSQLLYSVYSSCTHVSKVSKVEIRLTQWQAKYLHSALWLRRPRREELALKTGCPGTRDARSASVFALCFGHNQVPALLISRAPSQAQNEGRHVILQEAHHKCTFSQTQCGDSWPQDLGVHPCQISSFARCPFFISRTAFWDGASL